MAELSARSLGAVAMIECACATVTQSGAHATTNAATPHRTAVVSVTLDMVSVVVGAHGFFVLAQILVRHDLSHRRLFLQHVMRPPGFQVHRVDRVDWHERVSREHLAGRAVDYIQTTIAIGMGEHLSQLALHLDLNEDVLVDAIVIVKIVRIELIKPARRTRVGIARKDDGSPLVIARTLIRIPRTWICSAVEDQIELSIGRALSQRANDVPGSLSYRRSPCVSFFADRT